ncbi:MAG TPA: TetR/AcrR family transcriptional regulator [Hanamia sp.]|nr:TetR/AcrR family transcriptional regulator [Hanamia sp.]
MPPRTNEQFAEIRSNSVQSISDAAMKLFTEKGYSNVTIDQIAKKAKVSKGLMYNYFSGKEELLEFITNRIIKETFAFGKDIPNKNDPVIQMITIIGNSFSLIRDKPDFCKMIMPLITQKGISSKLEIKMRGLFIKMTKDMEVVFKACSVKNATMEAYQFGALMDGIAWHYFFLFKEDYPLDKMEKELIVKYKRLLKNEK